MEDSKVVDNPIFNQNGEVVDGTRDMVADLLDAIQGDGLFDSLQESYWSHFGNVSNPYASMQGFGWLSDRQGYHTQNRDRLEGRYSPVYDNEIDLRAIRQACRLLIERVPVAKAMRERLVDYTISKGFEIKITHDSPDVQQLCQRVVDKFIEDNDWESLEIESFEREHEEGEFIASLRYEQGHVMMDIHEGDYLSEPVNTGELESWLQLPDRIDPCWTFGVLREKHRRRNLGYHITRDLGADWQFYPERHFVHWKRNSKQDAKRGFGDHYTTHQWLSHGSKVLGNTAHGAAIQAAIAYVVEHANKVTSGQAAALAATRGKVSMRPQVNGDGTTSTQRKFNPGTVVDLNQGSKYHAGLLGSNNSQIYITVMEACMRLSGTIWAFPEHMLTGYAGNNNRASSETAESPFIQGRLRDIRIRSKRTKRLVLKILRMYFDANQSIGSWEEIEPGLDVAIGEPEIVNRDEAAVTAALVQQAEKGWVSNHTAMTTLGRDVEDEQAKIADEQKSQPGQQEGPAAGRSATFGGLSRMQWTRNNRALDDVLGALKSGGVSARRARVMLRTLGLDGDDALELIQDAGGPQRLGESIERFLEAWDPSEHPRYPKGHPKGGKFMSKDDAEQYHREQAAQQTQVEAARKVEKAMRTLKGRKELSQEIYESLDADGQTAMYEYSGIGIDINQAIRDGRTSGVHMEAARALEKVMQQSGVEVPAGTLLHRVVEEKHVKALLETGVDADDAFVSTTVGNLDRIKSDMEDFDAENPVTLNILLADDIKGLPLQGKFNQYFAYQDEVLLEPGTVFELEYKDGNSIDVLAYKRREAPDWTGGGVANTSQFDTAHARDNAGRRLMQSAPAMLAANREFADFAAFEDDTEQRVSSAAKEMFGHGWDAVTRESVADAAGALDNASVMVDEWEGQIRVSVKHPDVMTQERILYREGNETFMLNDQLETFGESGIGREIFRQQVVASKRLGLNAMKAVASGDGRVGDQNGYYTWARYGYDGPIESIRSKRTQEKVRQRFPKAKTMLDLMSTQAGRDFWRDNGTEWDATFDLADGSRSLAVFEAYLEAKGEL